VTELLVAIGVALAQAGPSIWAAIRKGDVDGAKRKAREETDRVIDAFAAKHAAKAARKASRTLKRATGV
jgi:hypothetical protein